MKVKGTVTWFNERTGYGVIKYDDYTVFVHHIEITGKGYKKLTKGDTVEFALYQDPRNPDRYVAKEVDILK